MTRFRAASLRLLPTLLAAALLAPMAAALPIGFLGGQDSIIRIQNNVVGSDGCGTGGGPLCAEAVGVLPYANYAVGTHPPVYGEGLVDPAAGTLAGLVEFVNVAGSNAGRFDMAARDFFTVTGPTVGETISVTAQFALDGFFDVATVSATADAFARLGVGPGSWDSTYGGLASADASDNTSNGFLVNSQGIHAFDLLASHTFDVTTGDAFEIVTALSANVSVFQTGSVTADLLDTGTLSFLLPEGYSISSALGYGVPEPGIAPLLAMGLGLIAVARRRALVP